MPLTPRSSRLALLLTVAIAAVVYSLVLLTHTAQPSLAAPSGDDAKAKADEPPAPNRAPQGSLKDRVGITAARERLGPELPTGVGVVFGHVEGKAGDYMPHQGRLAGVRINARSGKSEINGHANATAKVIYSKNGLAPGVHEVNAMTSSDFIGPLVLKLGAPRQPDALGCHIFTHSWISSGGTFVRRLLRRADYLIDRDGVIMVAGVNNGSATRVPAAMASTHNGLAVGNRNGNSSKGPTQVDGVGRSKPDLVAPKNLTSFSTPVVAAIAARLLEAAWNHESADVASRPETIKAALMAGAEKPPGWKPHPDRPLDPHLGAGSVRFDLSYQVLTGPMTTPGRIQQSHSWSYQTLKPTQTHTYTFDTPQPTGELSVVLTWHRRVNGQITADLITNEKQWNHHTRLANLDLQLIRIDAQGESEQVKISKSTVDNVEHIYLPQLEAGRYELRVMRQDQTDEPWTYALAWRIEPR